jgi:hypothetical protein
MAPSIKTVGGGPATGLAKDWTAQLDKWINTGSFGTAGVGDPSKQTSGGLGILNDILSSGAGTVGGALAKQIADKQAMDVGDLRARFGASGGVSLGTPAAFAEGNLRAKQGPEAATAIGGLQLSALGPLLQMISQLSGMGIPQASTVVEPNPWLSGIGALGGAATGAGNLATGLKA